ncbi:MarC family integral membrane protein [hydrothermal vent metagenome]|uniref:MarC family integral membrane protein n=1 Tax=hydrothermal vent metagenome TaxID=652676 RepID=A0A3B0U1M8_9ZZZZ
MLNNYFVAMATFFATLGVADIAIVFAALTKDNSSHERLVFATRGAIVAAIILLFFGFLGNQLLDLFGITLPALRTAGGILLMLIAIDMVFARHSGGTGTTDEEEKESRHRHDISVFPLAMPLLAGPGSISAVILLTTGAKSDFEFWMVLAALISILFITWITLLAAIPIQRLLGLTGLAVVSRIVGILLAALSVQFIFDGIKTSGLLG